MSSEGANRMKNFRLEKKHVTDCVAVENAERGVWDSPWYLDTRAQTVYRDALGRKNHGFHRWLTLRCNNTECNGKAIVREGAILVAANAWASRS